MTLICVWGGGPWKSDRPKNGLKPEGEQEPARKTIVPNILEKLSDHWARKV